MALPTLDATFASAADLPRRQMLAKWLVNLQYSGSVADYWTLPEHYLWAKIAVAAGAPRSEADYISLPKNYIWSDLYNAVSGSSGQTIDRGEKEALGWIAAAVRGDAADPAKVATYISWPWRYQIAAIITALAVDSDTQSFIATSGATDVEGIDRFVKGVKALGLWNSMVCWPLRSSQNAGTGTTAFSLGGLGTFNGTLVNGPTWHANGVDITNDSNQHISTAFNGGLPAAESVFAVAEFNAAGTQFNVMAATRATSGNLVGYTVGANWSNAPIALIWDLESGLGASSSVTSPVDGSFNSVTGRFTRGGTYTSAVDLNGTQRGTASSAATPRVGTAANLTLGNENSTSSTRSLGGKLSFAAYFNVTITPSAVHGLYKSTLGTGLGLP